jgi:hypothetical protein
MIPSFVGRPYRLANRHADADIPCVHKTISAIRWADSRVFENHIVGVYEVDQAVITTAFTVASASRTEVYLDTSYDFLENIYALNYSIDNDVRRCHLDKILPHNTWKDVLEIHATVDGHVLRHRLLHI